jgi:hypothetical protein
MDSALNLLNNGDNYNDSEQYLFVQQANPFLFWLLLLFDYNVQKK